MCNDEISLQRGDIVMDTDQGDVHMLVVDVLGEADEVEVDGQTVAEYDGCDDEELVFECVNISDWDWVATSSDELLDMVDSLSATKYKYPRSQLEFY